MEPEWFSRGDLGNPDVLKTVRVPVLDAPRQKVEEDLGKTIWAGQALSSPVLDSSMQYHDDTLYVTCGLGVLVLGSGGVSFP